MKTPITLLLCAAILTTAFGQGDFSWAISDNYSAQHDNYCFDLAIDSDNNLLSVGRSSKSSGSDNQLIVYKHNSDGGLIWKTTFNYTQYIGDAEIEVTTNHDIAVVASFRGDITVGSETYTATNSQEDILVAKLDSSGAVLWSAHDGRTDGGEGVEGLTMDGNGNVYYAGKYSPFTTYVGTDTLTNGPGAFLAKYDATGTYQWHMYSSVGIESVAASSSSIYVYGNTSPAGFNTVGDSVFTSTDYGSYIAKLGFDGTLENLQFEHDNACREIIVTSDDRVFTTGFFNTAGAVIAGDTLSPVTASIDSYVGRYDLDLNPNGAYQISATGFTNGYDIAASSNGHYVVLGQFAGELTFAGNTITDASGFSHQVFVLEFDASDNPVEIYHVAGQPATTATEIEEAAISAGTNDDFYINGYLKGKANFGTIEVNPGGNQIHMWLAQIGEAGALGIKQTSNMQVDFEVFPNPFSNQLNVEFDQASEGKIQLIDITGRVVHTQAFKGQRINISVDHLSPGNYFIDIRTKSGVRTTQQVVVI